MNIFRSIDHFLNRLTMYRVVLYALVLLVALSFLFSFGGVLSYQPTSLVVSLGVIVGTAVVSNAFISRILKIPTNTESTSITALILFLVLRPTSELREVVVLVSAVFLSMASKYMLAWNRKHIFNPVAIVLVLLGVLGYPLAGWWVATPVLAPFTFILGALVVRKIRRTKMVAVFFVMAFLSILFVGASYGANLLQLSYEVLVSWPLFFFATFMLTEPLTTPAKQSQQLVYAGIIGLLFGSQFHVGPLYSTPELALVIGNIFSYVTSHQKRFMLRFVRKKEVAKNTYDFVFESQESIDFEPGQYMEWTLPHAGSDDRGNRRYFTVASSPTESEIHLGVRMSSPSSSYKSALLDLEKGDVMAGGEVAGDFTLPSDRKKPLVFIAGGIGITPFRSMIQYIIDTHQERDITLFYVNRNKEDIAYKGVFDAAKKAFGLKTVYVLTDAESAPKNWRGETGYIDETMIQKYVEDCQACMYYLSGPNSMVEAYQDLLQRLKVSSQSIVTDYFPGF